MLAFGTERHGLSDELLARADARISIPMRAGVSSLNLATSVAAVLFAWRLSPRPRAEPEARPLGAASTPSSSRQLPRSAARRARDHPVGLLPRGHRPRRSAASISSPASRACSTSRSSCTPEVLRRRAFLAVAVVRGQAVELRPRDLRLARLDRVQHREVLEQVVAGAPRLRRTPASAPARRAARRRDGAPLARANSLPQRHVRGLLLGVAAQPGRVRRPGLLRRQLGGRASAITAWRYSPA